MKVTIVGAGISGLCTAWTLVKLGHAVTLIEQGPIPNPLSASGDQHRLIRWGYGGMDNYARAMTQAFDAWDELWADLGETFLVNCGIIAISQFPGDDGDRHRDSMLRHGHPFTDLTPLAAAERFPWLDPDAVHRVIHTTEGGALLCQRIGAGLNRWLTAKGASVRPHTVVQAVDLETGAVTLGSGEVIEADRVVVSAGAWTPQLFPELQLPLKTYRTTAVYLDPPEHLRAAWAVAPGIHTIGGPRGGYGLPPVAGTELKIASGSLRVPTQDANANRITDDDDPVPTQEVFGGPIRGVQSYTVKRVINCCYTFTDDDHFWSQWTGKTVILSACSGHGFKYGAAVGRWVGWSIDHGDAETLNRWLRAEATPPVRLPA